MADLIITNGDSAAGLLAAAGKQGRILPWRDILHEGPIVAGPLETSSQLRAAFLADRFRIEFGEIAADFAARDAVLRAHGGFNRIELWFEHDLYDQLQLVQILASLADIRRRDGLFLIQADDFLGSQRADTILKFASRARPIDKKDLDLAEEVWADLAMPTPEPVARQLDRLDERLPFLRAALHRFLEELPAPGNGLNRTEATALAALAGGRARPSELFRAAIAGEEAAFMGDMSFFRLLEDLAFADVPLIAGLPPPASEPNAEERRFHEAIVELTETGEDVLAGRADRLALNGIDRWWGGTRLRDRDRWRYDRGEMKLVPPDRPGA